jgi:Transposase DDE domain group 1
MLLRPGNAGSNTFDDHKEVLDTALKQVPAPFRRKVIVRIDGAGASHDLVKHLLTLSSPRKMLLFTCGWMITASDEAAITAVPEDAWKPGVRQDGTAEDDKDVAEITHLMSRAGKWPGGLRWIARRVKPSRRHLKNLTAYERQTGWKYSITCTNIPDDGIPGVPGSHHPQYIDVLHRDHATVETAGVRTAKAMGLRNLPSKTWQVNKRWVLAANIAADLTA